MTKKTEYIIKDTHRGLLYRDGVFEGILSAGRHRFKTSPWTRAFGRPEVIEVVLVDMRSRELIIKGQEILTADKVALRVSIVVQFAVIDPKAAVHAVESYQDRLYSDVQLAARRALARMTLEEILTNRNRLSSEILEDVKEISSGYGIDPRKRSGSDESGVSHRAPEPSPTRRSSEESSGAANRTPNRRLKRLGCRPPRQQRPFDRRLSRGKRDADCHC